MLYEIGFIGCVAPNRLGPIFAHHITDYAKFSENLHTSVAFMVHPAFRPALDVVDKRTTDVVLEG